MWCLSPWFERIVSSLKGLIAPWRNESSCDHGVVEIGWSHHIKRSYIGQIPNLYYKVVDGNQETLFLYMDDLFQTGEEKLFLDSKKEACYGVWDERPRYHARLLRSWSVAETERDYVESRKVCRGYFEEIHNDGLQIHDYIDDDKFEVIWWHYIWEDWCHHIQANYWFVDVLDEHEDKYILYGEHLESVYGWLEIGSLDCRKAYTKGTIDYGLRYVVDCEFRLVGYIDLDWACSVIDRKSTSGCCFSLGSTVIVWRSRKQMSVVLNTTKGEHIHDRVEKGAGKLLYIAIDEQVADMLTKPLSKVKLGTSVTSLVWSLTRGSDDG